MGDLSDFVQCVQEFMDDFGAPALIIKITRRYDPATGKTSDEREGINVLAILLDLPLRNNGLADTPNTLIQTGDKRCFIQPSDSSLSPSMPVIHPNSDKMMIAGREYKVITFKQVNPMAQTKAVLYELILRE